MAFWIASNPHDDVVNAVDDDVVGRSCCWPEDTTDVGDALLPLLLFPSLFDDKPGKNRPWNQGLLLFSPSLLPSSSLLLLSAARGSWMKKIALPSTQSNGSPLFVVFWVRRRLAELLRCLRTWHADNCVHPKKGFNDGGIPLFLLLSSLLLAAVEGDELNILFDTASLSFVVFDGAERFLLGLREIQLPTSVIACSSGAKIIACYAFYGFLCQCVRINHTPVLLIADHCSWDSAIYSEFWREPTINLPMIQWLRPQHWPCLLARTSTWLPSPPKQSL